MSVKEINIRVPATCRPRGAKDYEKSELSESIEEYVEGIWRLEREVQTVGTGEVAQYMNVSPASATMMLKRLASLGLVEHLPYQWVKCTEKGEALAVNLLKKHRLIERLLVDYLELPWDAVHDLACKLEHYVSMDVANRIGAKLGHPTTCPHGNPIDATFDDGSFRLLDVNQSETYFVVKVTDEREDFLGYIQGIGLVPGAEIFIEEKTPFGDVLNIHVRASNRIVAIGKEVATAIFVRSDSKQQGLV